MHLTAHRHRRMPTTGSSRSRAAAATSWHTAAGGLLAALLAIGLTACGDASSDDGAAANPDEAIPDTSEILSAVELDPAMAATLPPEYAEDGTLTVGSYLQSAPGDFYAADGKTVVGYEVDLMAAVASKLGLKVHYEDMPFDSLIASLQSGRVDVVMAAMNDTAERQKQIDFVDYLTSGITLLVQKGNPDDITGPDSLCGHGVAVVQGTTQEAFANEQSDRCVQAGEDPVEVSATDSDSQNQNQLRTGRVSANMNDLPTAVYLAQTAGGGKYFEIVPAEPINGGPYGIGVNKEDSELTQALQGAMQSLIDDGTYSKIVSAWGVERGAIEQVAVNGGS